MVLGFGFTACHDLRALLRDTTLAHPLKGGGALGCLSLSGRRDFGRQIGVAKVYAKVSCQSLAMGVSYHGQFGLGLGMSADAFLGVRALAMEQPKMDSPVRQKFVQECAAFLLANVRRVGLLE